MMYTCDISKNLKDGIARLHTEDGKMMLNVYIIIYDIYIVYYIICGGDANALSRGSEKNIAPIFTLLNNILHFTDFPKDLAKVFDV